MTVVEPRKYLHLDDRVFRLRPDEDVEDQLASAIRNQSDVAVFHIYVFGAEAETSNAVPLYVNLQHVQVAFIAQYPARPGSFV
jgi:hypothetical protein